MQSLGSSIRRTFIPLSIITLLSITLVSIFTIFQYLNNTNQRQINTNLEGVEQLLKNLQRQTLTSVKEIALNPFLVQQAKAKDHQALLSNLQRISREHDVQVAEILSERGEVLAESHRPTMYGQIEDNKASFLALKNNKHVSLIEKNDLGLGITAKTWLMEGDSKVGILEISRTIDYQLLLQIKDQFGVEGIVFDDERLQATTFSDARLVLDKELQNFVQAAKFTQKKMVESTTLGGHSFMVVLTPLFNQGDYIGSIILALPTDYFQSTILNFIFFCIVFALVVILILIVLTQRLTKKVVSPITNLSELTSAMAAGDFKVRAPKQETMEIGVLANSFNRMGEQLNEMVNKLEDQNRTLEKIVEERTEHLEEANKKLNHKSKMDAIGQLAGGVAHDFNNLLQGIISSTEMAFDEIEEKDEELKEYLQLIHDSSIRAGDLTAKLLAFGRKAKVTNSLVDINQTISDSVAILKRTVNKKISIVESLNAKSSFIIGDQSALQSALMNLGINSSHAMENGGTIELSSSNIYLNDADCESNQFELSVGPYVKIEVKDNGCGIPPETLERIFEPFFTTKEQGKGTGLGLSAVYGTVLEHRGAVKVYSEVDTGTSFMLFFPCVEKSVESEKVVNKFIGKLHGTVLLVDDEEAIRTTGKYLLEKLGLKVLLAETGKEAVEMYRLNQEEISLVISDMIMPEMDGQETFRQIREISPAVPVIISSGFSRESSLNELLEEGLNGFLQKPFRLEQLHETLQKVMPTM